MVGDGHDKLYHIGFPVWAVVNDATAHWLAAWVVPSNQMGDIIVYLYLSLIEKMGGMFFSFHLFLLGIHTNFINRDAA